MTKASQAWLVGFLCGWVIVSLGWETGAHSAATAVALVIGIGGLWFWNRP